MAAKTEDSQYIALELESLEVGMILDRPIYVHLPANNRYVQLAKPLQQLEQATFDKLKRVGKAFTSGAAVDTLYPDLAASVALVREICEDSERAPFEKNREAFLATKWLYPHVFGHAAESMAPVFFVQRAFGVPRAETLLFVSDFSVATYERGLRLGAIACILTLWLGYVDSRFLAQLALSSFCRELAKLEGVPGVGTADQRFCRLAEIGDSFAATSDELAEVIEFARWLTQGESGEEPLLRVTRKLKRRFERSAAGSQPVGAASAGKAAA